jgi:hypothetical protein
VVEVLQEDRELAGAFIRANEKFWLDRNDKIMRGEADDDPLVQLLATVRIKATSEAIERAAEVAERFDFPSPAVPQIAVEARCETAKRIATAIRSLSIPGGEG